MLATACPPSVCHPCLHHVSWARSACRGNSSHHSYSGSYAGGGKVWTGCWHSLPESGDNMGAPNMPRGGRPPQNCLLLTLTLSAAVLSLSWLPSGTAGPHVVLGRRKGAGAPFQAHRPCVNTVRTLHSGAPPGCSAQAHTWLSFSPWPLRGPGGRAVDTPQSLGWVSTDPVF